MPPKHLQYESSRFNEEASCFPTSLATAIAFEQRKPAYPVLSKIIELIKSHDDYLAIDVDQEYCHIFLEDPEKQYIFVNDTDIFYDDYSMGEASYKLTRVLSEITNLTFVFTKFKNAFEIFTLVRQEGMVEITLRNNEKRVNHSAILRVDHKNSDLIMYHDPLNKAPFAIDIDHFLDGKKIKPRDLGVSNATNDYMLDYIGTRIVRKKITL